MKRPDLNKRTHTQTTGVGKLLRLNRNPELIFSNAVKNTSTGLYVYPRLEQNKKVNPNLVKTTRRLYRPTAMDTIPR